jgi:hypothetical protein
MTDFREDLKAAMAEHAEPEAAPEPVETPAPEPESAPVAEESAPAAAESAPVAEESAPAEPESEALGPPSSWKADYHEQWRGLPRDVQEQVLRREEQSHREAMRLKELAEKRAWADEIEREYDADLRAAGATAGQAFRHFMGLHKQLQAPDPLQRKRVIYDIARSVGVELDGTAPPPMTAAEHAAFSTQAQLQSWMRQQAEAQEMQRAAAEIEAFRADKPHFDAVREEMAALIKAGLADSLTDAYDRAVFGNPNLRAQAMATPPRAPAVTAQKRAAAVSPKSSSSTATTVISNGDQRDTIRAALRMHRKV